jgi:moderate conductance mechanosensitive channel
MERLTGMLGFEPRYIYAIAVLALAGILRILIGRYLRRWANKTKGQLDDRFVDYLEALLTPILLIAAFYYFSGSLPLPARVLAAVQRGLVAVAVLLVLFFSARLVLALIDVVVAHRDTGKKFMQPLRTLSNVSFALIGVAYILKVMNVNLTDEAVRLVRIIGVIVGAYVVLKILRLAIAQMEILVQGEDQSSLSEAEKRAKTLGKVIYSAGMVLVIGVAVMMILSEMGMNIAPIVTGAGIAGLAVGFGAQNLVRDVISGFFLILEDQIRVGDVAKINGIGGNVEAIRIRTTVLRDDEGVVHIFPNGAITQVANMTKQFSYYVVQVGVSYKENVDRVMEVLKIIGDELEHDSNFAPYILAPLEILGVDGFGESNVNIKIRIKTVPHKQWMVGRELRRRIKNTFDTRGIEIPFPHLSVYFGESSKPFGVTMQTVSREVE